MDLDQNTIQAKTEVQSEQIIPKLGHTHLQLAIGQAQHIALHRCCHLGAEYKDDRLKLRLLRRGAYT